MFDFISNYPASKRILYEQPNSLLRLLISANERFVPESRPLIKNHFVRFEFPANFLFAQNQIF
jgi:hypothetical protein